MSCHLLADALQHSKRYEASAALTAADVLQSLNRRRYDVVLLGCGLADGPPGTFELVREIKLSRPDVSVIVLLDSPQRELVVEAFCSGAQGVFCRADSFQTLCKCIHCVYGGQVWANSAQLEFVLDALRRPSPLEASDFPASHPLSKREAEIARLVADGLSNRQISHHLSLSEHTVKNYLFRIFEKLEVSTRVELALYFLQRGRSGRQTGGSGAGPIKDCEPKRRALR